MARRLARRFPDFRDKRIFYYFFKKKPNNHDKENRHLN